MGPEKGIDQERILADDSQSSFHCQRFFQKRSVVWLHKRTVAGIQVRADPPNDAAEAVRKDPMIVRTFGVTGNPDRLSEDIQSLTASANGKQGYHNGSVSGIPLFEGPASFRTPFHPVHPALIPPIKPFQKPGEIRTRRRICQNGCQRELRESFFENPAGPGQTVSSIFFVLFAVLFQENRVRVAPFRHKKSSDR
jgi:hypothetical protein